MIKIFHLTDLHLDLRFQNHPETQEALIQARYETLHQLVEQSDQKRF